MLVIDTNVLVYAADISSPEHQPCRRHLEDCRTSRAPWYLTWGIIYEFVRVVTHPRVFRHPWTARQAWAFIETLLASPTLGILVEGENHPAVAAQTLAEIPSLQGNLIHDLHTAILMREHGLTRILTRDTDFHRFPFLKVQDPLQTP